MNDLIIKIQKLFKNYIHKNIKIPILKNIELEICKSDIISIVGPSGVGKTTFLNIIGLLDNFDTGEYHFNNVDVSKLNHTKKNKFRNEYIGFIHQFFYLIPELTILENVALPNMIMGNNNKESFEYAKNLLDIFDLYHRIDHKPSYLSGGEQQRAAIARALINKPILILADEMTGNLDEKTADKIFDFFINEITKNKQTLIYATHNFKYAKKAKKKFNLSNGKLYKI